jgi:putative peptidoglycan lipid II flippase
MSDIVAHCTGSLLAILTGWGYLIAISSHKPKGVVDLMVNDTDTSMSTRCESGAPGENVCTTGTGLTSSGAGAQVSDALKQSTDTPKETSGGGVARHARTVMGMTMLSRFTGLFRDSMLASLFGLGPTAVAFTMGFLIPNLFRRLFGEGALSAAFIPQYTTLLHEDRKLARRFAWAMVSLLMIGLSIIVLISEAILIGMLKAGTWSQTTDLTLRLVMVMMPYMPLVCTVALVGGMLQVHGKFGPTAAAPILLNLAMIIAAVMGHVWVGPEQGVFLVAGFVLVAGVLQLLWQMATVWRDEPGILDFANTRKPLKAVMLTMGPMLLGLAVFQINSAMDMFISYGFSSPEGAGDHTIMAMIAGKKLYYPIQAGAVAALNWSQRLYQFPLGVFGIAVATAIFPALSRCAASDHAGFAQTLRNGLRLTVFIGLPASVGLIMVRLPLTRLIFQYGKFDLEDANRVATILVGYAVAIWAYSATHVLTRGFYAIKDPKTPLKITMANVLLNVTLNCVLIWYMGAAGLAWSTAICAIWQTFLLVRAMRRYVALPLDDAVLWSWGKTLSLSVIMGMVLYPVINRVDLATLSRSQSAVMLGVLVLLGAGVYLAGAWVLKSEELRWLLKRRAR